MGGRMKRWEIYLELLFELLIALFLGYFVVILLPKLMGFFWPFVLGYLFAISVTPVKHFLERHIRWSNNFGAAFLVLFSLFFVLGIVYFVVTYLVIESKGFMKELPYVIDIIKVKLEYLNGNLVEYLKQLRLPEGVLQQNEKLYSSVMGLVTALGKKVGDNSLVYAGGVAKGVTNVFIGSIIMILSAYLFLVEQDAIKKLYKNKMPKLMQEKWELIQKHIVFAIGGFIKAQIKIMGIIFILMWIGLWIAQVKYTFLLAILITIWDVLPFVGTGMILVPWSFFRFLDGDYRTCIVFLALFFVTLLARQILQPKMVGDSIGLKPLPTLVLLFVGLKIGGLIGCIFVSVLGIIVKRLYEVGLFNDWIERIKWRLQLLKDIK